MARIETEGMEWLKSNHQKVTTPSSIKGRQVRAFAGTPGASFYTLKHKENQRKRERESDCSIQDQEWCEGSKEAVLWAITRGVENDPLMVIDHG